MYSWHTVAIADLESRPECAHRAYLDPEEEWNDWACLYFETSEVERMAAWLPEFDDGLVYSAEEDTFTTTYDPDLPEAFQGEDVDGMHLYPHRQGLVDLGYRGGRSRKQRRKRPKHRLTLTRPR